jgi:hypothetical protein
MREVDHGLLEGVQRLSRAEGNGARRGYIGLIEGAALPRELGAEVPFVVGGRERAA